MKKVVLQNKQNLWCRHSQMQDLLYFKGSSREVCLVDGSLQKCKRLSTSLKCQSQGRHSDCPLAKWVEYWACPSLAWNQSMISRKVEGYPSTERETMHFPQLFTKLVTTLAIFPFGSSAPSPARSNEGGLDFLLGDPHSANTRRGWTSWPGACTARTRLGSVCSKSPPPLPPAGSMAQGKSINIWCPRHPQPAPTCRSLWPHIDWPCLSKWAFLGHCGVIQGFKQTPYIPQIRKLGTHTEYLLI